MASNREDVKEFVSRQIASFTRMSSSSIVKEKLAKLRRGLGKVPGCNPELWDVTLEELPERFYRKSGEPTKEEWAVYVALTLYALHQQGNDIKQNNMNKKDVSLGTAVRILDRLRDAGSVEEGSDENAENGQDDNKRRNYRFDRIITAQSITELANHLRGMVQLLKQASIPLDYAMLAGDIYGLQLDAECDRVRLRWGQDYYRRNNKEDAGSETANDNQNN